MGTIAVNSGLTKMVIALLRCGGGGSDGGYGAKVAIKVLELEPGLAHLGGNLEEAAESLRAHDLVIESLQSKQTPVEELLRQADDLIANQRPKAEVYSAMAESLGQAWKDLNDHLDQRKDVLKLNFNFHGHFEVRSYLRRILMESFDATPLLQDFQQKVVALACISRQSLPSHKDVSAVRSRICDLNIAKRAMLESSAFALQEGDALLQKLSALWQLSSLDSRPGIIKQSVALAMGRVSFTCSYIFY